MHNDLTKPGKNLSNPWVSVIVPNYNHAPYLIDRLESILNQSFQNFEVIILDDNSTDESREIIEPYRSHIKVKHIVYNDCNSGSTFKQWQKGLALASGEWIWIAESDDVASINFIEVLLNNSNDSDLVFCNSEIIDDTGCPAKLYGFTNMPSKETYSKFSADFIMNGKDFSQEWMTRDNFIPNASAVIFKSKLLQDVLKKEILFQEMNKMKLVGDWYFWLNLIHYSLSISYINEGLNQFRFHNKNVRSQSTKNSFTELSFILSFFKKNNLAYSQTVDTYLYRYFHRNKQTQFTLKEKFSFILESLKFGFFILFMKSWIKQFSR